MDSHFVRTSTAMPRHRPSTSRSSTAKLGLPENLVIMKTPVENWKGRVQEHGVDMYSLENIVGYDSELPASSYSLLKKWICEELKISPTNVFYNTAVKEFQDMTPIFTSTNIRPDVSVYNKNNIPLLFIEVHSSPYEQTIDKLVWVLIEHLRWLRNCKTTIHQCVGFAFPKFKEVSSVMKVTCIWKAKTLHFQLDYSPLPCQEVAEAVRSAYKTTSDMCNDLVPNSWIMYGIPLCTETLQLFGESSTQLNSHYSCVIQSVDVVYKYAFDVNERERILILENLVLRTGKTPQRYLLPQSSFDVGDKRFVTFKRLLYPMSCEEVKSCFRAFVVSVCEALHELHSDGIAHLDIRLENICFCPTTFRAVLIDLDRSKPFTSDVGQLRYGKSVMYDVPSEWAISMVDFRQLGVLIYYVSQPVLSNYHEMKIPQLADKFVASLFEGKYCPESLSNSVIITEGRNLEEVLQSR